MSTSRTSTERWQEIARIVRQLQTIAQQATRLDDLRGRDGLARLYTAGQVDDALDVLSADVDRECVRVTVESLTRELKRKKERKSA